MRELALHAMDIVENSIAASAKNIKISITEDTKSDRLSIEVADDGKGMDPDLAARVIDPFVTSRTTRKVGLGIPLLKAAAEACNGHLTIQSAPGKGTRLKVDFQRSHIDRMPLGDLAGTLFSLVITHPEIHWSFHYQVDEEVFNFDDQPVKEELEGISLCEPEVLRYLRELITSGIQIIQKE